MILLMLRLLLRLELELLVRRRQSELQPVAALATVPGRLHRRRCMRSRVDRRVHHRATAAAAAAPDPAAGADDKAAGVKSQ
jgi:hypothetical protein